MSISESQAQRYQLRDPDIRLMLAVRDDDAGAFEELMRRYQNRLITVLEHLVGRKRLLLDRCPALGLVGGDAERGRELGLGGNEVGGRDQREQLLGPVPALGRGVRLDLAYDGHQQRVHQPHSGRSASRSLVQASTSSMASSRVCTFTSWILSES